MRARPRLKNQRISSTATGAEWSGIRSAISGKSPLTKERQGDPTRQAAGEKYVKRTWTIIGVRDVARSFEWYQSLFGQPLTRPAHEDFGQLCDSDGTVLLCLHQWGAH